MSRFALWLFARTVVLAAIVGDGFGHTAVADETPLKKIVLIAGDPDGHPANSHEYAKSAALVERCLESSANAKGFVVETHTGGWPQDESTLDTADTIVLITSGSDRVETNHPLLVGNHLLTIEKQMNRGCGLMTFHYSTFAPNRIGQRVLEWTGGYFDYQSGPAANGWYSKIQFWQADAKLATPEHPISRGVKPFRVGEEFYYNIRFLENDPRLTPILSVRPPGDEKDFTVGWAVERKNGGRGFGFTGGHPFDNWKNEDFRKLILNAICWTAHVEVPEGGVQSVLRDQTAKAMIVTGHQYPGHPWRETTLALEDALRKDTRLQVSSIPDVEFLAKPELHDQQVIVLNYCNWEKAGLSDEAKTNFIKYLQNGGGLVIVHFTNGAWHYSLPGAPPSDWPEWRTKICRRVWDHVGDRQPGDKKSGHDGYGPFTVNIAKPDHPITRGMTAFETTDELYFDQQGTEPIEILATAHSKVSNQDAPMAFVYPYGKGRVFQTVLGHDAAALRTAGAAQLVLRGTLWAAGLDPGQATATAAAQSKIESTEGKFGKALDARTGGFEVKPNAKYHTPPYTVECWAKLEPGGFSILVAQSAKESTKHWELFTWSDNGTLTAYLPGCTPDHVRSEAKIADGKWHYLAMTFDGQRGRLYVDGRNVADAEIKCHEGRGSTGPLWIGAYPPQHIGCNGLIDEVRISNTIRKIGDVPSEPFANDEHTIGLWRFDDNPKKPVVDESKIKADALPLSAAPQKQADDHFFGWTEAEGNDERWQKTDTGRFFTGTIRLRDQVTARALCVRLGDERQAAILYDKEEMNARCVWKGPFLNFDPGRFGLIGMPSVAGDAIELSKTKWLVDEVEQAPKSCGLFVNGDRVVLSYDVAGVRVLESPWIDADGVVTRTFEIAPHQGKLAMKLGEADVLSLPRSDQFARVKCRFLGGDKFASAEAAEDLSALTQPGASHWNEPIVTQGKPGEGDEPYVVDTLTLPFDNPYHALFFTSGFDFYSNGDAAICTAHGDVWRVRGIDDGLKRLEWKRFATGLYQPLGLKIVDGLVYVLGRDQITCLHDNNSDGEADYYENFNSDSPTSAGGHDYSTCLETDSGGNFYFLHAVDGLVKISRDGKSRQIVASGFRNPNGLGIGPDDTITVSPQEGNWTPGSSIMAIKPGGYYGFGGPKITPARPLGYDPPMVWLPRPLDNSSGGQVWAMSNRFGPLSNQLLHLSYGRSSMLLVLRDEVSEVQQGAVAKLPLQFDAGVMRGRVHPRDGQVYVVGQQGWVSNAVKDGCFQRVRYTGKPANLPIGVKFHEDGIALTFTCPLDKATAEDVGNYNLEQWNYRWTANYGSPDYKVSEPNTEGHDEIAVRAAKVLEDGCTVFLAIDRLQPVMQISVDFSISANNGSPLKSALYGTIHSLHQRLFDPAEFAKSVGAPGQLAAEVELRLQPGLLLKTYSARDQRLLDCSPWRLPAFHNCFVGQSTTGSPAIGENRLVIEGYLKTPLKGTYRFRVEGARNAALEVNGKQALVGDTRQQSSNAKPEGSVELAKGFNHFRLEFATNAPREATARVDWSGPGFAEEPIPPSAFYHDPEDADWKAATPRDRGRDLFAQLMCVRCHETPKLDDCAMLELAKDAPRLDGAGARYSAEWLAAWISNPREVSSHATMPKLFHAETPSERQAIADIVAYLQTIPGEQPRLDIVSPLDENAAAHGEVHFERLGCIACHSTESVSSDSYDRHSLRLLKAKFQPAALLQYLKAPHARYAWSTMPDFKLSDEEAGSLTAFLLAGSGISADNALSIGPGNSDRGKELFKSRGCASCHTSEPTSRKKLAWSADDSCQRGCLAPDGTQHAAMPDFGFSDADRHALARFVATDGTSLGHDTPADASRRLMQHFRCNACHSRDGVSGDLAKIILDEGGTGLPPDPVPSLTWAGEKLKPEWTERLLAGKLDYRARPWFDARMPVFPPAVAKAIAHGLSAEHGYPPTDPPFSPDPKLIEIGKRLSEKNGGLDCRQCHGLETITKRQPNDAQAISFLHVPERIRKPYYDRWMRDPLRIDPATKMPKFAADGQHTVVKDIFDGDAAEQFDALWHYLQSQPH